jgi:putative salt-induced outer membrane protein
LKALRAVVVGMILIATASITMADTLVLGNGDRLSGTIVKSDGKVLTFKGATAGDVTIKWTDIKELTSDKSVYIVTKDKTSISGTVTTDGSVLVVHSTSAGDVRVAVADVTALRCEDEEKAYLRTIHPTLRENWNGALVFGFSLARGNSQTTNLALGFNSERKTTNDDFKGYMSTLYTKNNAPGGGVTADLITGGAAFDRNFTPKAFAVVSADYSHDQLQDLHLQSIYTVGLGWHAIATPNTTLDAIAGINYTKADYNSGVVGAAGVDQNVLGATLGEIFMHKFGASTVLNEQFYFYPNVTHAGPYRMALDASSVTKLKKWLGLQFTVSDRYISDPPIAGTKANDIIFTTGLNIAFSE